MMTELAALTFSSKAVQVGSSCSLEKQGVTGYSIGKKGCGVARGAAAQGPPQTPESWGLCTFPTAAPSMKEAGEAPSKIPPPNRSSWGVIKHWI